MLGALAFAALFGVALVFMARGYFRRRKRRACADVEHSAGRSRRPGVSEDAPVARPSVAQILRTVPMLPHLLREVEAKSLCV